MVVITTRAAAIFVGGIKAEVTYVRFRHYSLCKQKLFTKEKTPIALVMSSTITVVLKKVLIPRATDIDVMGIKVTIKRNMKNFATSIWKPAS